MGKTGTKMPNFCLNKMRPLVRIRSTPCKNTTSNYEANVNEDVEKEVEHEKSFEVIEKAGNVVGRRIMIVIDKSVESKSALQWALTHNVQVHDQVVLLYVKNATNKGDEENNKEMSRRVLFLSSMKSLCKQKRPEVKVEVIVAEGKEKGPVIVEEAQKAGVCMLILGEKKRLMTAWRLVMIWATGNNNKVTRGGMVEYCIQNATCMAIGVRRKSKKLGGYLITTKRHKDFWLLA